MSRTLTLWLCVAAAPLVWFLSLEANFAFSPYTCTKFPIAAPLGVSIAALVLTAIPSWIGWAHAKQMRPASGPPLALAIGAAVINAGAFLVILAQAIPIFMRAGCP